MYAVLSRQSRPVAADFAIAQNLDYFTHAPHNDDVCSEESSTPKLGSTIEKRVKATTHAQFQINIFANTQPVPLSSPQKHMRWADRSWEA